MPWAGLKGQSYDFTGEPGSIYALISDVDLELNALFSRAYTSGIHVDGEKLMAEPYGPSGTWVSALGLQIESDKLRMSVEDSTDSACGTSAASDRLESCLMGGSVALNDASLFKVGSYESDRMTLTLKNSKSFARVEVESQVSSIM